MILDTDVNIDRIIKISATAYDSVYPIIRKSVTGINEFLISVNEQLADLINIRNIIIFRSTLEKVLETR